MRNLHLHVTLWPSFPHFQNLAFDSRISGIRLNSAQVSIPEMDPELKLAQEACDNKCNPLWFDIKGRQLRVVDVIENPDHLELTLNHEIDVPTPVGVLFKAGTDFAVLDKIVDKKHLIFQGGPQFLVRPGESLHIRDPKLKIHGPIFTPTEKDKIAKVLAAGFTRFYLSYVEEQEDIDEFREMIGNHELILKIESKRGLDFVAKEFVKDERTRLMAARGDLYVEIDRPHQILEAMKLIIEKDRKALAGSRMLLSVARSPVPEACDFSELAWLYDIGYRSMLLCDEICLKQELLSRAVGAFDAFRSSYAQ